MEFLKIHTVAGAAVQGERGGKGEAQGGAGKNPSRRQRATKAGRPAARQNRAPSADAVAVTVI